MHLKAGEEVYRSTFYVLRNLVISIQKIRVLCKMGLKTPSDCQSYHVVAKNESFALTVLRGSVEALLRRDFQLADKTVVTLQKIFRRSKTTS
jgi:hypothetical protein